MRLYRTAVLGFITPALMFGISTRAAAGPGAGIKAGVTFPNFKSADADFTNRTGWHLGLFVGGKGDNVVSV